MDYTNLLLEQLSLLASLTGDPMQRVATHFMEGLAARTTKSWPGLYKALNCTHLPTPSDLLSARQIFFNLCPYLKFGFTIVNHSILDAMEGEKVVHIIDLGASEAIQWVALLQMLSTRVGGPPHLRITIINQRKEVLDQLGQRLSEEAETLDIPFQFHPVVARLEDLDAEMLRVKTGEAVAVSSVLQLHYLLSEEPPRCNSNGGFHGGSPQTEDPRSLSLDRNSYSGFAHRNVDGDGDRTLRELFEKEAKDNPFLNGRAMHQRASISPSGGGNRLTSSDLNTNTNPNYPFNTNVGTKADRTLRMLRSLAPKIMVVMEQESNHNGVDLMERFVEALHYYGAMFDSLECSLPPKLCGERLALEKHLFGREIHNIVACEGLERVERHEKLEQWKTRAEWAGFSHVPFCYSSMIQAKRLLLSYTCESYRLVEDRGCLTVCWQETPLFSASAWQA